MKSLLNSIIPGFLKRIDHFLLTRYPIIWSTRVHYFIFYSLFLTNVLALIWGLVYPLGVNGIPDFTILFELWRFSFVFGLGFLGYYAYLQSYTIKNAFSWKEVLLRTGIYLFCVASVFVNTLVFPHIIRYRVKQIIPKQEFYQDLHTYALEDYRTTLLKEAYYADTYDHMEAYTKHIPETAGELAHFETVNVFVRYPKYQRLLLKSSLNKNNTLQSYIRLCHTLDSLLPKPSNQERQNYKKRKAEMEEELNKDNEGRYKHVKYWQVFDYLRTYRDEVIHFIKNHPTWQPEFKESLVFKIRNLDEFIFSLDQDFGAYAPLLFQSEYLIHLKRKYIPFYTREYSRLNDLNVALMNIYQYQHCDFFFQVYTPGLSFNTTAARFYGAIVINKLKFQAKEALEVFFDPLYNEYDSRHDLNRTHQPYFKLERVTSLEQKTKAYNYYLNGGRVKRFIAREIPQEILPPSHSLFESYAILWLAVSLFILVAHTLTIRKFAILTAINTGLYALLYLFFYENWTYEMRYMLGVSDVRQEAFMGLIVPQVLICLSVVTLIYFQWRPQNQIYSHLAAGVIGLATLMAGVKIFLEMRWLEFSHTDLFPGLALEDSFYLYILLFIANVLLYWRYTLLHNRPSGDV